MSVDGHVAYLHGNIIMYLKFLYCETKIVTSVYSHRSRQFRTLK
jgi:hypothetical protein